MTRVEGLIVGGGPSGLTVAYGLQGDTLVLEKVATAGGLRRSIKHGGGVFGTEGHSFHTPYPEVSELVDKLLSGGLDVQERDARVYTHGGLIPYPFQKIFDRIRKPAVVEECRQGLSNLSPREAEPENFEHITVERRVCKG